jgi:arylsulfatase A-like enzyme
VYGYQQPTSPALERVATDGALFLEAFSTASWTLPSHAGMFTGLLPGELDADWRVPLGAEYASLPEVLRDRGYATAGFVANPSYTHRESGLARGFVHYAESRRTLKEVLFNNAFTQIRLVRRFIETRNPRDLVRFFSLRALRQGMTHEAHRKPANLVVDEFLAWQQTGAEGPFFAFLNLFDAHVPYLNSDPGRFGAFQEAVRGSVGAYNAAIASQDAQIGRLIDSLTARGLLDRTLLIIASDHGELFGEHGLLQHGHSLYLPEVRVPLLIRYPPRVTAGLRVAHPVSIRDIPATVFDVLGMASDGWDGRSLLLPSVPDSGSAPPVIVELGYRPDLDVEEDLPVLRGDLRSVFHDGLHYIAGPRGQVQLFEYRLDTAEANNLSGDPAYREREDRLRAILDSVPSRLRPEDATRGRAPVRSDSGLRQ